MEFALHHILEVTKVALVAGPIMVPIRLHQVGLAILVPVEGRMLEVGLESA